MSKRKLNILFTCAGRRVALLGCFRRAMAELGVKGKLIAADCTEASSAYHSADVGELVPLVRHGDYMPTLMKLVEAHEVGLLVPLTDLDLRGLARQRDRFAQLGCTVMIGSEADIKLCRNKEMTSRLFDRAGLAAIRTARLKDFLAAPFFPCFVKPIGGSASIGAKLIRNKRELEHHVKMFGKQLIAQEYVPGQEFTIDVYRDRAGVVRCIVPRQRLAVRAGEVAKGVTAKDPSLIAAVEQLSGSLGGLWGVFCCQCRRGADGVARFFEINPRFGGGAPLSVAAGANLPLYLLQEVLGMPITATVGDFTDKLLMLRYDDAVFVQVPDPERLPGHDTPQFR